MCETNTFKEFTFTFSNINATPPELVKSEYVGYEARKYGIYQTTPADENEEQKNATDENKIHSLRNSEDKLSQNLEY